MKKNILFIIPGLDVGGAEKSLVNLLSEFDYSKYNVDLFLLNKEGLFVEFLPKEVNILKQGENLKIFSRGLCQSIKGFLVKGNIKLAYYRIMFFLKNNLLKNKGKAEQYTWKYLRSTIGRLDKKYDVAIGYLEKTSNYICVDCVQANKKIGWIHNDYRKLDLDKYFDKKYFNKLDYLATVSEKCKDVLQEEFPFLKERVKLIYNIISKEVIDKLAKEKIEDNEMPNDKINILSIGRLDNQKGFDMAIEACKSLIDNGNKVCWTVIGEGNERSKLEELIIKNELKDSFKLIGLRKNPYKYLKTCDIYVQPSRFEGKSIAIDEAKILCKPIVTTNFTTVLDQIEDGKNGIIADMDSNSLSERISKLIYDNETKNRLVEILKKDTLSIKDEVNKLYCLFD